MRKTKLFGSLVLCCSMVACAADEGMPTDSQEESGVLADVHPGERPGKEIGGDGGSYHEVRGIITGMRLRTGKRVDQLVLYTTDSTDGVRFGGNGGSQRAHQTCRVGETVVGFYGIAGGRIENLGLLCASRDANGRWNTYASEQYGGWQSMPFHEQCRPETEYLAGVNLRSGSELDMIQIVCRPK